MPQIRLTELSLPEFGEPTVEPVLSDAIYADRLARFRRRAEEAGYGAMLVYGDREHSANLAYLTGYDPRFEEALLILVPGRTPALLIGNEGMGYARAVARGGVDLVLYQPFSLLGQPRERTPVFADLLRDRGIDRGMTVGVCGWKYYGAADHGDESWIEIPAWIVDAVRSLVGESGQLRNAGALMMDASTGLRATLELDELARMEFAACHTSQAVRNLLFSLKPGLTELDAVRLMRLTGLPWSVHLMLSAGPRAAVGLPSPSLRKLHRGEPFTVAYGVAGALTCRAGFLVGEADELPVPVRDYVDRLAAPYFTAIVEWYETVGIGVTGGALREVIDRRLGDAFFGIGLNPGHLIHLDEWVHSPVYPGSTETLRSGQALQVDVIPATGTAYFTANIEDGIALADADLRAAFAAKYPEAWRRIEARRAFMTGALGIRLEPEVLPFSNLPAYLPPYILSPSRALAVAR